MSFKKHPLIVKQKCHAGACSRLPVWRTKRQALRTWSGALVNNSFLVVYHFPGQVDVANSADKTANYDSVLDHR